jgi:predicted dehydrogenase
MIDAARARGLVLSVYHNRREDADYLAIRRVLDSGAVGEVFHVEGFLGGWRRPHQWWRSDKAVSGGAIFDMGAHFTDWILGVVPGSVREVTGLYHKRVWHGFTNEDQAEALMRFESGATADLQISSIAAAPKPKWRILGTRGALVTHSFKSDRLRMTREVDGVLHETDVPIPKGRPRTYYPRLADHLLLGEPNPVTPESARRVIAVLEAAERSARSGRPEPVAHEPVETSRAGVEDG